MQCSESIDVELLLYIVCCRVLWRSIHQNGALTLFIVVRKQCSNGITFLSRKLELLIRMDCHDVSFFFNLADAGLSNQYNLKNWVHI